MNKKAFQLEDLLSSLGFDDKTVVLGVASLLGGQAIRRNHRLSDQPQTIKSDGSTVGTLDQISGRAISKYVNSTQAIHTVRFKSEENTYFKQPESFEFAGIFDELDGSINPLMGGTNLYYIGVGGVIHQREGDKQIAAAVYLPFDDPKSIFVAEKGKGTYRINLSRMDFNKLILQKFVSQKNTLLESGWMSESTLLAEQALRESGFYREMGYNTARDKNSGGMFQTIKAIRDNHQVLVNFAPSHQADYCYLLLQEAGADVIGQDGSQIYSTSYAMLSIAPSFSGDKEKLKNTFVEAMRSPILGNNYMGVYPGKIILNRVCE
ncbi:hypothetical protein HYS31_02695 [Candidatus Woesearchaeota archaeon]|nr:hypothetical protein [Candidatus Woesearchaeota archaeon]